MKVGQSRLNKIFIIYANAGAGHRRAAESIAVVAREKYPAADIRLFDVLDYMTPLFRFSYPRLYLFMVNYCPWLWAAGYYFINQKWVDNLTRNIRRLISLWNGRAFIRLIEAEAPQLILTTHFLPNEMVSLLKQKQRYSGILATCLTDYEPHIIWKDSGVDLYMIATADMMPSLKPIGIPEQKVTVTGIPIHPVFGLRSEKAEIRQRLGLAKEPFTVLITSGGFGVGPIKSLVTKLMQVQNPLQILVICGDNPALKEELTRRVQDSRHHFQIYGFVQNIHELMDASDILISKSGGLTSTEAMAKGLPMLIYRPIPGQETGNCQFLLRHHGGKMAQDPAEINQIIEMLANDPVQMRMLRENMARLGNPQAAKSIVAAVDQFFTAEPYHNS